MLIYNKIRQIIHKKHPTQPKAKRTQIYFYITPQLNNTKQEPLMQFKINFKSDKDIILPFQYNHILQGSLLSMIHDEKYAEFLHNRGYTHDKRNFKLYTFSRIMGQANVDREKKEFHFGKICALYVASMDNKLIHQVFTDFTDKQSNLRWKNNIITTHSIDILEPPVLLEKDEIIVKTVSPITTYSTLYDIDHTKKIYYYSPYEKEFQQNIAANLKKKYFAFYGTYPKDESFQIVPIKDVKACVLTYKGKLTKGYTGIYAIKGSKEMLNTALCAGLGNRNSIGFGMVLFIRRCENKNDL